MSHPKLAPPNPMLHNFFNIFQCFKTNVFYVFYWFIIVTQFLYLSAGQWISVCFVLLFICALLRMFACRRCTLKNKMENMQFFTTEFSVHVLLGMFCNHVPSNLLIEFSTMKAVFKVFCDADRDSDNDDSEQRSKKKKLTKKARRGRAVTHVMTKKKHV